VHRQLSDKDCAITAIAHATGLSYTHVVNSFPGFRFLRARRRLRREKDDQIIGRRKRMRSIQGFDERVDDDRNFGRYYYNQVYRVEHFPYFCHFGLADIYYRKFLKDQDYLCLQKLDCPLSMLRHVPLALLSLPSINVKVSGHMVIWRAGRIWDPSPRKRYDYARLRSTDRITCLALTKDEDEYDRLRKVLRVGLHGREVVTTSSWNIMVDMVKVDVQIIDPSKTATWWGPALRVTPSEGPVPPAEVLPSAVTP
jgi:hypothetical protein